MKVDFVDLKAQYTNSQRVLSDIETAVRTGSFMGASSFENKLASYINTKYCVGVGSGTDALWLSLLAMGIGPGDKVIVPANTYIATAFAVSHTGATPLFVDPDPETYLLNTDLIGNNFGPEVKAIIPVHLYGYPVDMDKVMDFAEMHGMFVIEDCAQSIGADSNMRTTGSIGDVGCFSFYPTKNLGGLGQGGAITTNNEDIARKVRELGNVGRKDGSWFEYIHKGFNSRLDAINAIFLEAGLEDLEEKNYFRLVSATLYNELLSDLDNVITPPLDLDAVYHLYELKCHTKSERDGLKEFLESNGIACGLHYPVPCHRQPVYGTEFRPCPVADELADTLLSLPMHPFLGDEQIEYVCEKIKEFFN